MSSEYDPALTMIGLMEANKVKAAYEKLMFEKAAEMNGNMCWPVDWFPEPMPIESASGNATWFHLQALANPMGTISTWPQVDGSPVQKEDILVFADGYGYCTEILQQAPPGRIGMQNVSAKAAEKYTRKEVETLVSMHSWSLIIFATGMDPPASSRVEDVHATQEAVVKVFLWILKKIADDATRCKRLAVLTVDTFAPEREIHEECGLGLITNSALFGMCNTARMECPCPIQYIDTEWALRTENSKHISAEIFRHHSFGHNTVRILNGGRYVQRKVPSKLYEYAEDFTVPDEGVIAISGGSGGLGLVMGIYLLSKAKKQGGARFSIKFLSRTGKVKDQDMPNWKEVERIAGELGVTVEQEKCDVSKSDHVDEFVKANTPNITGFIHSAGVLQDGMMASQTWDTFEKVFAPKSRAAVFIHDALERYENPDLSFFWLFSSISVYGSMGQLNYSASNAVLDALARHRRALGKPCLAPQWGPWGDVGMAAHLDDVSRRRMANSPTPYFSNEEGLRGLESLVRTGLAYGEVHKCNAPLMFGMVQGDETTQQCFQRNFQSWVTPPPPSDPQKNPYITCSYEKRRAVHFLPSGLNFQHFWPEVAQEMLEDLS